MILILIYSTNIDIDNITQGVEEEMAEGPGADC